MQLEPYNYMLINFPRTENEAVIEGSEVDEEELKAGIAFEKK